MGDSTESLANVNTDTETGNIDQIDSEGWIDGRQESPTF